MDIVMDCLCVAMSWSDLGADFSLSYFWDREILAILGWLDD
jgi:hypothetical protein